MPRNRSLMVVVAVLAALLTGLVVYASRTITQTLEREASLRQHERAVDLSTRLSAQLLLSSQIADTTAALAGPSRDRAAIENTIERLLSSTSPDFVYGIGVWFEPYAFDGKTKYYGPYVHRDPKGLVLTFEWDTPEYDYPSHAWYQLGRTTGTRAAFTEPYFDIDYVYMTTTRSIYDPTGKQIGVVSVDLILPQLRELVAHANSASSETFYVTTPEGKIFAHPDELRLLAWMRTQGKPAATILDVTTTDLAAFEATTPGDRITQDVAVPRGGWTVHVTSDRRVLFAASTRVRWASAGFIGLLWFVALASGIALGQRIQAKDLAREVELRDKIEAVLREDVRQRDEFLSLASHELRTPLTPLLGRLQLIKRQLRSGQSIDMVQLERALAAAQRLRALVDELLDTARVHLNRLDLEPEPISFTDIVRRAAAASPPTAGHHLDVSLPTEGLEVFGDAVRLEQVVRSLIGNAMKYSPHGGTVTVNLQIMGEDAVLSVHDEGIGIPFEEQGRVFQRYFRASNAPGTSFPGLGLGLFISRDIIEHHDGRIWVDSEKGHGSTFYVAIPLLVKNMSVARIPIAIPPSRISRASNG